MSDSEHRDSHPAERRREPISSPDNRRIKALRRLAGGRGRRAEAHKAARLLGRDEGDDVPVLLEGPHLLEAALGAGLEVTTVIATDDIVGAFPPVLARFGGQVTVAEPSLLESLADADSPRGLVAVGWTAAEAPVASAVPGEGPRLYLDRVADPGNLGAVLRVAEAAGTGLVALSPGCVSWRHPRALRASAGSALRLCLREEVTVEELDDLLATADGNDLPVSWAGLSADGTDLYDDPCPGNGDQPSVLALGSEAHGLSPAVHERCDRLVALPMSAAVESLNVAVATGIALYEWRRRRSGAGRRSTNSPDAT